MTVVLAVLPFYPLFRGVMETGMNRSPSCRGGICKETAGNPRGELVPHARLRP